MSVSLLQQGYNLRQMQTVTSSLNVDKAIYTALHLAMLPS